MPHGHTFVIKNKQTELVLDAGDYHIKCRRPNGCDDQLWRLEHLESGKFIIVCLGNGKVVDIQGGAKERGKLITFDEHETINQQWYVDDDGTIVSPVGSLAITLDEEDPNQCLIVSKKHGGASQVFKLEHKPQYPHRHNRHC